MQREIMMRLVLLEAVLLAPPSPWRVVFGASFLSVPLSEVEANVNPHIS